jgi:hypothetical protein
MNEPRPTSHLIPTAWRLRARGMLRSDPRKLGVAGVVGVVAIAMLGRAVLTGTDQPATATAAAVNAERMLAKAAQPATATLSDQASPAMQEWVRGPIAPMGRNLFAIKLDYYPQDGANVDRTLRAPTGDGFWDKLAKSMASRADQRRERQILVENLQLQAMQLRLQSTVTSATPSALVNGSVFREGDVVASFRVLKIEARRIVVEREGIKLEIPMD